MENECNEDCLDEIVKETNSELGLNLTKRDIRFSEEHHQEVIRNHLAQNDAYWDVTTYRKDRWIKIGKLIEYKFDSGEYAGVNQNWESGKVYCFHLNIDLKNGI